METGVLILAAGILVAVTIYLIVNLVRSGNEKENNKRR